MQEPLSKRSLLIPRAALDESRPGAQMTGGVMLDGSAPATRLLTSYLDTLSAALPELDPIAVSAARNATLELFIGALRTGGDVPESSTTQPALRAAMDRYIERHLIDAVSSATIAKAHGVSVRTVNRVFNATGQTVGEVDPVAPARPCPGGSDRGPTGRSRPSHTAGASPTPATSAGCSRRTTAPARVTTGPPRARRRWRVSCTSLALRCMRFRAARRETGVTAAQG